MKNRLQNHIIGCDWGTSSFRLRLINTVAQKVIAEIDAPEGVASTFEAWKKTGGSKSDKLLFFVLHLEKYVALLASRSNLELEGVEIVISGMASSSIGMREIPYSTLPFELDGTQVTIYRMEANAHFPHNILLISGIRSDHDVMRGEETQMIGLAELLHLPANKNFILILPGTHSKHLYLQNNRLVDFQTYMTGELFNVISNYSILKESVEANTSACFSAQELAAFKTGVRESDSVGILKNLFRVRTNQLFQKLNKKENGLYLSGLLIGAEIKQLLKETDAQLVLCSGNNLSELYEVAINELNLSDRTRTVSSETVNQATVIGQLRIFQQQALVLNSATT